MRLRNKKTGEIADKAVITVAPYNSGVRGCRAKTYRSIAELTEEWEGYKEPKDIWWLDNEGQVNHASGEVDDNFRENRKIGNYFLSREEAEKAVKRLKALERLKGRGFKFELWDYDGGNYQERIRTGRILFRVKEYEENDEDLDLLFKGQEEE